MPLNLYQIIDDLKSIGSRPCDSRADSSVGNVFEKLASDLEGIVWLTDGGAWEHKAPLSINDKGPLGRNTNSLEIAAIFYFSQQEIQRADLDWLYVDLLIFYSNKRMEQMGEKLAGDQFAGTVTHGIQMLVDGRYLMGTLFVIAKAVKWLTLLGLVSLPLFNPGDTGSVVLAIGAIAYILSSGYVMKQEFASSKTLAFERIWAANRVYSIVQQGVPMNWQLLAQELIETRKMGVPWLSAIDVAVRARNRAVS